MLAFLNIWDVGFQYNSFQWDILKYFTHLIKLRVSGTISNFTTPDFKFETELNY